MPAPDQPSDELNTHLRQLRGLIYGNWNTCVTCAFAELNLADLLAGGERTVAELAQATGTDAGALKRFLRCAAGLGLVAWQRKTQTYRLAPLGELLTSDHPHSQRAAAQLNGADYRYQPWGRLVEILQQGSSRGISPTAEQGSLAYLADHPAQLAVFHRAMTDLSTTDNAALARAYDFSRFTHVMDVGGGEGTLLKSILRGHPTVTGTLFDLATTLPPWTDADECEYAGRLHLRAGDFFQSVPAGADCYVLKNVVHNWPEARALQLLGNVRAALLAAPHGVRKRLLIVEYLLDDGPSVAAWLDLNFLVLVDGRERTLEEYRDLGARAGLVLVQAIPTPIGRYMLEFAVQSTADAASLP
jgi:hypothetical protein